ncbi:MAG: WD40 repeat domain-containing protein, partial [Anaerolineae bacterium]|nr:WD40 repeat domain-containing protein [Anaerolineae bacterium]
MRIHWFIVAAIILTGLSACSSMPLPEFLQTSTPTLTLTFTPTLTATPSPTPLPTNTPLPTATPQPTPTPRPVEISASNIQDLNVVARIGNGAVLDMAFSPDGSSLLVLSTDRLSLIDTLSGDVKWSSYLDMLFLRAVFSADGKKIITMTQGGGLQEWDAVLGLKGNWICDIQPKILHSLISDSGNRLMLTNRNNETVIYDTAGLKTVGQFDRSNHGQGVSEIAMTSGGERVLLYGWNTEYLTLAMVFNSKDWSFYSLSGIGYYDFGFDFSGDDKRIAALRTRRDSGEYMDATVLSVWPADGFNLYTRNTLKGTASQVVLSQDGNTAYLVMSAENRIARVDLTKATEMYYQGINTNTYPIFEPEWMAGHEYQVSKISASRDGKWLASVDVLGNIKIWDLASNQVKSKTSIKGVDAPVLEDEVALIPDKSRFAHLALDHSAVLLMDASNGNLIKSFARDSSEIYSAITFSPDGSLLSAVATKIDQLMMTHPAQTLVVWDVASGKQVMVTESGHGRPIVRTRISSDNQMLASVSRGQLIIWEITTGAKKNEFGGFGAAEFSPDNKQILYDNADYGVYISDIASGKILNFQRAEYILSLIYAPHGLTAAVGSWSLVDAYADVLFYFQTQPPYEKKEIAFNGMKSGLEYLAYSPDGKLIASIDTYGALYINDTQSGAELY